MKCNKFRGVVSDHHLSKHIKYIKSKVSKSIGIINRIKQFVNKETLRTLYFSFVYPYLFHCIEAWGNAQECYRETIVKLQKRAVRIISCSSLLAHSEPLFIHLKILQFKKTMNKYEHNLFPSFFNHMYVYNRYVHKINTRQAGKVRPAKYNTVLASKSLYLSYLSIVYIIYFFILAITAVVIFHEYSCMVKFTSSLFVLCFILFFLYIFAHNYLFCTHFDCSNIFL